MKEETKTITRVGCYSTPWAKPEDCKKCKNAKYATVIVDDICLNCRDNIQYESIESIINMLIADVFITENIGEAIKEIARWAISQNESDFQKCSNFLSSEWIDKYFYSQELKNGQQVITQETSETEVE